MLPADSHVSQLRPGLAILLEAFDWTVKSASDLWDFAVKLPRLRESGATDTHLWWLSRHGYLEHALEFTLDGDEQRTFRQRKTFNFRRRSCFILSHAGADFARSICRNSGDREAIRSGAGIDADGMPDAGGRVKPNWNSDSGHLTYEGDLVLMFLRSAPNEEPILDEFQKMGWPARIDAPPSLMKGANFKGRLQNAIKQLNRKRIIKRIHFAADGSGHGIRWRPLPRPVRRKPKNQQHPESNRPRQGDLKEKNGLSNS